MISQSKNADLYSHLEKWGQNDLNLLHEFGPSSFSTPQLFQLRVALMDKLIMADRRYKFLFLTLLCSLGWAMFGTGLMIIGFNKLAYVVFGLFVLCTGVSSVGMLLINNSATGSARLNHYLELIQNELGQRRQVLVEN
jgi:hypothetical protein